MSVSLWNYNEQCKGRPCVGDCDKCMRPHPWLPEFTSYGDTPKCDNCKRFGERNENRVNGICGRTGWICGSWEEADEVQMMIGGEHERL